MAADGQLDKIRKEVESRGIEFFFAQFVDMYARPSAKLIPAAYLDDLATEGAGFAGFAAGEIGQVPADPDIAAIPDLVELHARSVAAEPRPVRVRHHGRGRAVAVLPAHDPAQRPRGGEVTRVRVQARDGARVLPRPPERGRLARDRRPAGHAREALLRHGRDSRASTTSSRRSRSTATSSAGGTTRTTTRMRTVSSSRTSSSPTRSSRAIARSSSATWSTRSPSSTG